MKLTLTGLATGGDAVGRDASGRVTFVPLGAPGDVVEIRIVKQTTSFARGEIVAIETPSPSRVTPPCPHFLAGCGGCQWQHVAYAAQLAAKQDIVANALRNVTTQIEPILSPSPPLGWRRRARFHVRATKLGLYRPSTNKLVPLSDCPQLEPPLDAVVKLLVERGRHAPLPEGEVAMVLGHRGEIVVAFERPWKAAPLLVGAAGIVGAMAEDQAYGVTEIEIEPGVVGTPWDFAQASATGNAVLISLARAALGKGPGHLLELYAGAGNFTRGFREDGWTVTPTDGATPRQVPDGFVVGPANEVIARLPGPYDAIVLDPPRAGAPEVLDGILRLAPPKIVYISCDPATLARDLKRLDYRIERVQPIDLMPQTSHVEVVTTLVRSS